MILSLAFSSTVTNLVFWFNYAKQHIHNTTTRPANAPYILCPDCTFSRKHQRLLVIITNMLATTISTHPFLEKLDDEHDVAACELCLALQQAIFVTNDFQNYVKDTRLFTYTDKPSRKSAFDDSYDFLSDPDLVSLRKPLPKPYWSQVNSRRLLVVVLLLVSLLITYLVS